MTFGQLIAYNMNIFFEKSFGKNAEESIPGLFSKKKKMNIFMDQYSKYLETKRQNVTSLEIVSLPQFWNGF